MALLPVEQIAATGTALTPRTPNAGGDTVKADDRTFLRVVNTNAATRDVTVTAPTTCNQGGLHNRGPVTIPATTGDNFIPLESRFNDPTTGVAAITYTAVTGLTVYVGRV